MNLKRGVKKMVTQLLDRFGLGERGQQSQAYAAPLQPLPTAQRPGAQAQPVQFSFQGTNFQSPLMQAVAVIVDAAASGAYGPPGQGGRSRAIQDMVVLASNPAQAAQAQAQVHEQPGSGAQIVQNLPPPTGAPPVTPLPQPPPQPAPQLVTAPAGGPPSPTVGGPVATPMVVTPEQVFQTIVPPGTPRARMRPHQQPRSLR